MGMLASRNGVVNPHPVVLNSQPPFREKPSPTSSAVGVKGVREWLNADRVKGKHQTAGPQHSEAPLPKGTNRATPSTSIKCDTRPLDRILLWRIRKNYVPGFEKNEKKQKKKNRAKLEPIGKCQPLESRPSSTYTRSSRVS